MGRDIVDVSVSREREVQLLRVVQKYGARDLLVEGGDSVAKEAQDQKKREATSDKCPELPLTLVGHAHWHCEKVKVPHAIQQALHTCNN